MVNPSVCDILEHTTGRLPERCRLGLWYSPRLSYDDSDEYDIVDGVNRRKVLVVFSYRPCHFPTTALDVTIQAQVLELMSDLKEKMNTSLLLITHDILQSTA